MFIVQLKVANENGIVCLFTFPSNATVDGKRQYRLVRSTIDTVQGGMHQEKPQRIIRIALNFNYHVLVSPHQTQIILLY